MADAKKQLAWAVDSTLKMQGVSVESTRLADAERSMNAFPNSYKDLQSLLDVLGLDKKPPKIKKPDRAFLPLVAFIPMYGWGVIVDQSPEQQWIFKQSDGVRKIANEQDFTLVCRVQAAHQKDKISSFNQLIKKNLYNFKAIILEAVVASVFINILALAASLFSMQVYDRVIPLRSEYTLIILAVGVFIVILVELLMKFARSKIMDQVVVGIDSRLSREVYQRLLNVRADQLPGSVGTMAAQLRGYEQVRNFYTATTLFTLVDVPVGILFLVVISIIGSPIVAVVPLVAAIVAMALGLFTRKKIDEIAMVGAAASYRKTGILVETVEGVETIKAGAGGWKFLSRWLDTMGITIKNDLDMKHSTDYLTYASQSLHQISYVGIVIAGSYLVMAGDMSMGGLIACSILGGRVLSPVMTIPNLLVQHSHSRAAEKNIDSLFALQSDNHGVDRPLTPSNIIGHYLVDNMRFNYGQNENPAIQIPALEIRPGERIGILGPIGSGKSTLLKLLSGLYAPTEGRILLDGLDLFQISRDTVSEQVAYLQQDHRLFEGTLRENLLIGMPDPGDDVIQEAVRRTGLINLIASHSQGLDLPIFEGGKGLSGGQKQLVAFTRILLNRPSVLLMDEPTASMDGRQEQRCIEVLENELDETKTLILSTHKTPLLRLVNRLIIISGNKIVMDGPRDDVLKRLQQNEMAANNQVENRTVPNVSYAQSQQANSDQNNNQNGVA